MAASLSLVVLYPNGHRQVFHVNSNTSIFQILEDACKKQLLNPADYDLYHRERLLSQSLPVSFTNLPNNAELELRATGGHRRAAAANVDICLQLESGERVMAQFPASASLLDVVAHWPDKTDIQGATNQKMDLVCVYMRKEVIGVDQLRDMTLQKLGLTSGKAVIRLLRRPKGSVVQQAHVSRNISVPFKKEEPPPPTARSVSPNQSVRPTSPKQARATSPLQYKANSPTRPMSISPDGARKESPVSGQSPVSGRSPVSGQSPMSGQSPVRTGNSNDNKEVRFSPPPTMKAEALTVREEDIKYIGERKAVLFNLEHCPPFVPEDLGDSFYEVTIEDAKYLAADYKRQREALEDRPLETNRLREQRHERMARQYPVVLIRIYFPDRYVLQGTFLPEERVADVIQFVRGFLRNGNQDFHLYTSPPKHILDPGTTLLEANLIPASVVHFGGTTVTPGVPLLRDDVLAMVSTPGGASVAASRLRSDVKIDAHSQNTAPVPRRQSPDNRPGVPRPSSKSPPKSPPKSPRTQRKSPPKDDNQRKTPKWFVMGKK